MGNWPGCCTLCDGDGYITPYTTNAAAFLDGGRLFQEGVTETCPMCKGTGEPPPFDPRRGYWDARRALGIGALVMLALLAAGFGGFFWAHRLVTGTWPW